MRSVKRDSSRAQATREQTSAALYNVEGFYSFFVPIFQVYFFCFFPRRSGPVRELVPSYRGGHPAGVRELQIGGMHGLFSDTQAGLVVLRDNANKNIGSE